MAKYKQIIFSTLLLALLQYQGGGSEILTRDASYREIVCPGGTLNFSCSGTGAQLEMYSPGVLDGSNIFLFFAFETVGRVSRRADSVAVLVDRGVVSNGDANMTVNMTLQLPRTTPGGDYLVFCNITTRSGMEEFDTANYSVIGVPNSPQIDALTSNRLHFTEDNVTVTVSWPQVITAENYSVNISPAPLEPTPSSHFTVTNTSVHFTVVFNQPHNITVSAANCGGNSTLSTPLLVLVVNCGYPPVEENVVVVGYSAPATNGSMVSFSCADQKVFGNQQHSTKSTCENNGRWNPDPSGLQCQADCEAPAPNDNVNVTYSSTLENSTLSFRCKEGLNPNTTFIGICQSSGIWSNDPSKHLCKADCGVPSPVANGSINSYMSTVEGAVITYQCNEGLSPSGQLRAVCQSDGTWTRNPADTMCRVLTGAASSPAVPVAIAVVMMLVLVIIVTPIAIILVFKVKMRGSKNTDSSQFGLELQDIKETSSEYCTTKHPGPRGNQSVTVNTNTLVYAGLDLPSERQILPSHLEHADNPTSYAEINFTATNKLKEVPQGKSAREDIDDSLNLDSLLIQLKPQVTLKWELFARVVGLSEEVIKDLSNCGPDERVVEMLDYWLRNHPSKPTWREVAQILEELHLYQLADDLLKVYETGELPIPFDMNEVPQGTLPRNESPPPLPPKLADLDDEPLVRDLPPKPPPHGGLPVHAPPPLPPPYHENGGSMLPPGRPPKSHSHGMPRRPPKAGTVFTAVPALPPKPKT